MADVSVELINRLSDAFGVSGCEDEVRDIILSEIEPFCDSVQVDKIGNIIAVKKAENLSKSEKTVMLMANMDESGFIISRIKEGGGAFLDFQPVGKIHPQTVVSERVTVGENRADGVISLKAVHLTTKEERDKPVKLSDLFIDIGAEDKSEAEAMVTIGDYAAFKSNFRRLGKYALCNKAAACRACCAVLIEALRYASGTNLICVFTAQRESGLRGSRIDYSKYTGINPDVCIVLDAAEGDLKLGGGAVTPEIINQSIADREVLKVLKEACGETENQFVFKSVDSDIKGVNFGYGGTLCAELDIPAKNMGTSAVIVDIRDINHAADTIEKFLNRS